MLVAAFPDPTRPLVWGMGTPMNAEALPFAPPDDGERTQFSWPPRTRRCGRLLPSRRRQGPSGRPAERHRPAKLEYAVHVRDAGHTMAEIVVRPA